jgi:hypothetical protein
MSRRGIQVKALLSMGILVGFGAVSTLAAWTGTATATSTISAATVSLAVAKDTPVNEVFYGLDMSQNNWFPGMSQAAIVTVKNTGSVPATYALSGTMEPGALGTAMTVEVFPGGTVQDASGTTGTCSEEATYKKSSGGDFPAAKSLGTLTKENPEDSASFCIQTTLPLAAASDLQGKTTSITLKFIATIGS